MKVISAKDKTLLAYTLIFLVVILLALYFLSQARLHQQQFRNLPIPVKIDAGMQIGFVVNRFGISEQEILSELQLPVVRWNLRYTIQQACRKNHLDCAAVVDNLNQKIIR